MNTPLIDLNKAIQASCDAPACNLPDVLAQIEELKGIFGNPSEKLTADDLEILEKLNP